MKSDEDVERWGRSQRRKGALRVIGAGVAALALGVFSWAWTNEYSGSTLQAKHRLFGFGAGIVGAVLVIAGVVMLARSRDR